ncbi:MAG TPA: ABC transporter permease [Ktedonobacteraceae bacterium]|nr:ABC transporter permease [Ktedonobacteraceae bacterium]
MSIMLSSPLARKSITDVTRRKGRTFVVVLAIFIGVLGLTGINVFAFKITDAYYHQQDRSHYPDITFSVARLDPALMAQIAALPNVQTVQEQMVGRFQWQTAEGPIAMNVIAFQDLQHAVLGGFELLNGHYPGPGEIVLEMTDLTLHSFSLNGAIPLQGQKGIASLRVAGAVQTSGLPAVRGSKIAQGYMRMSDLGQLLGTTQDNSIAIKVRDINAVQDTAQALRDLLQRRHLTMQNASIISSATLQIGLDFINGFFNLVRVLAAGAIVVSCFLIMNTLTTLIAEQMKIIGTMKVLGGTKSDILKSYLLTVLIYSLLGTFLGLALGITLGYAGASQFAKIELFYLGPFSIPLNVFLIGIGSGIGAPLLAALIAVLDGTRITVHEALGAYGVTSVSASPNPWLPDIAERLIWIPQTVWLGFRGIFRKRGRAIMTISALALSGVTLLAVTTFTYSINQMALQLRTNYTYDIKVRVTSDPQIFSRPLPQLHQILDGLSNVARVEAGNSSWMVTPWGTLDLEGVDVNTQVYRKPISAGRWFLPGEQNVVLLDEQILHQAHLSIGDTVTFSDGNGHKATWKIIGAVDDMPTEVGLGGAAITSIENVNQLQKEPANSVGLLYIQARDHSPAALQQLTNRVDQAMQPVGNADPALTKQDELDTDERSALSICIIFYVAAVGVAMVGILGLYNTLTSSVLERQREIGIWRSMGASNWQVSRAFWIEGLSLAGLAWLLGAIVGVPIAYGFDLLVSHWLFPVPFAFDAGALPLMLLALVVIATLASFGPTARASRARIATILRYE